MTKQIWLNLPVKNVSRSKEFFSELGFSFNTERGNTENSACMIVGEKGVVIMLFEENTFKNFTNTDIPAYGTEVLFSIDAESRDDVDAMAVKVAQAGGKIFSQPASSQGWMYGFGFADLDGHRWNVLYMDMSQIPA
ncbi:extradiol dioxygenase [Inquilinus sp. KBS0705]|nr:extradiol dioxygenase [Inquilinus sp. KBS0705]